MRRHGALLAGDLTGHFFFADRWNDHDDALYAAARIVETLARQADPAAALAALPKAQAPAELRLKAEPGAAGALLEALKAQPFEDATRVPVEGFDGLRLQWPEALCVIRATTTTHGLGVRFEGRDAAALQRAQGAFKHAFAAVRPGVALPL